MNALSPREAVARVLFDELASEGSDEPYIDAIPAIIMAIATSKEKKERLGTARIEDYVEKTVPTYGDGLFRAHFRMCRASFQALLDLVGPQTTVKTLTLETRTLACVWFLSNQETFRSVADRFGMSKGSLHYYLMNFCRVMTGPAILQRKIVWPKEDDYPQIAEQFARRAGFPGVIGAIDGTYIHVNGAFASQPSFVCRKGFPAIHLQGVCDSNLRFLDVFCAYPGSVHDSRVFRNSSLNEFLVQNPPDRQFHLLGDSAYALGIHLFVPFRDNGHLTPEQKSYNQAHSSTRVDIERSFGLLKGKFRKLRSLDCRIASDASQMIVTCCVLHTFLLERESVCDEDIVRGNDIQQDTSEVAVEGVREASAVAKRDSIMHMLG